ncbi:hypothetical protein SPSIL_009250 [Sporomusa silvacetica DSM 10669]|uniref:Uncharacterized protein n=1 Tax=Sporomusa silvacetica DSM 10669 TaxID=1123289 RepID=A0ABZ3IGM0_9FIRM|nr:hypothetical protein [Sporomusa silvacetica]OZC13115.1 hypothetical protein SPSIL_55710 [Sporomusa silvacetica DSM 10669]
MKNLFLYEKTIIEKSLLPNVDGVYDFKLCPLVGIDANIMSKNERTHIVKSARLRECFILQEWLINLIKFAKYLDITLMHVELSTPIEEEVEQNISKGIKTEDYSKFLSYLTRVMDFFECDIKMLTFNYRSKMISVTSNGVLSIYDDIIEDIQDSEILCVIAGYNNNLDYEEKPVWEF